jgi:hypothetical protein
VSHARAILSYWEAYFTKLAYAHTTVMPFNELLVSAYTVKADTHIACRAHAVPLPCRAVNSHMPCRAPTMLR